MPILFLIFILVPIIEMYFLIQVGSVIGAGWTILLVVATAVIGAWLVRAQGFGLINKAQTMMAQGQMPAMEMAEGLLIFLAGALLLTPGFFTDTLGFLLLVPPLRRGMIKWLGSRGMLAMAGTAHGPGGARHGAHYTHYKVHTKDGQVEEIIEGEFQEVDDRK